MLAYKNQVLDAPIFWALAFTLWLWNMLIVDVISEKNLVNTLFPAIQVRPAIDVNVMVVHVVDVHALVLNAAAEVVVMIVGVMV